MANRLYDRLLKALSLTAPAVAIWADCRRFGPVSLRAS